MEVLLGTPPAIQCDDQAGYHNTNWDRSLDRIITLHTYKGLDTVALTPTRNRDNLKVRFVQNRESLIKPPNHKFGWWILEQGEVGDAFNHAIWQILNTPDLMTWNQGKGPWIYTQEDDNLAPQDALTTLLSTMYSTPYAAVSGLYWTKLQGGCPQLWGDPKAFPISFAPQVPIAGAVQEVRGIGMGCALWDIDQFKDARNRQGVGSDGCPVWFKTWSEMTPQGARVGTQDLSYCDMAGKLGYRFAVNNAVRVGHVDWSTGIVW